MPPLASVSIPLFAADSTPFSNNVSFSPNATQKAYRSSTKGKVAIGPSPFKRQGRMYDDTPLPIKPVEDRSRVAKIQARSIDLRGVWYQIRSGEDVDMISVDRILEYVSPQQLEEFEIKQFEEERELLRIADAEDRRIAQEQELARKPRAKRKGVVIFEEIDDSPDAETEPEGGRPRPTYTRMFEQPQRVRRRRKRDPRTGVLMPLSDHDSDDDAAMEMHQTNMSSTSHRARADVEPTLNVSNDPPKKRRRKRDPNTGELLPLSPEPERQSGATALQMSEGRLTHRETTEPLHGQLPNKRPRRRRHPLTGDLMPLGWKWDQDASDMSAIPNPGEGGISPSMNRLTLSQEQEPKRRKVASSSSSSQGVDVQSFAMSARSGRLQSSRNDALRSASDESIEPESEDAAARRQPTPAGSLPRLPAAHPSTHFSPYVQSPNANTVSSILPNNMTSMLHPTPRVQSPSSEDLSEEHDGLDEDEFFIEAIIAHNLSDPRTHDSEYGDQPIMLYKVRWIGDVAPKTTWEPIDSFPDRSIVYDYHQQAGLSATII